MHEVSLPGAVLEDNLKVSSVVRVTFMLKSESLLVRSRIKAATSVSSSPIAVNAAFYVFQFLCVQVVLRSQANGATTS